MKGRDGSKEDSTKEGNTMSFCPEIRSKLRELGMAQFYSNTETEQKET